jgi:predicted P-loop ATPase/GTPase
MNGIGWRGRVRDLSFQPVYQPASAKREFDTRNDPSAVRAVRDIGLEQAGKVIDDAITSIQRTEGNDVISVTNRQSAKPGSGSVEYDQGPATPSRTTSKQKGLDDQVASHEHQCAPLE